MGIQFNQIDNLQSTFDSVSGALQGQITPLSGIVTGMDSGNFSFGGDKFFRNNVDFSGAQGILVDPNNIYTPNSLFAGSIKIGGTISTPRNSTPAPEGAFQVTGGTSFFDGPLVIRNNSLLTALSITAVSITSPDISGATGNFEEVTGSTGSFSTGNFEKVTSNSLLISGSVTGFVRIRDLPDYTNTGSIPSPSNGALFRSGNYLMVI